MDRDIDSGTLEGQESESTPCSKENKTPQAKTSGNRILLIDDSPDQLLLFGSLLRYNKYDVVTANSGQEGLDVLAKGPVDLIVCDVMMPEMDGHEFLSRVKSDESLARIPVVMLTAAHEDIKQESLVKGADMFCQKSGASKYLLNQIKFLLSCGPGSKE